MGTPGTRTKPGSLSTRTRPSSHRYSGQRTARRGGLTDHRVVRPLHLQLQRMHVNSGGEVVQRGRAAASHTPRRLRAHLPASDFSMFSSPRRPRSPAADASEGSRPEPPCGGHALRGRRRGATGPRQYTWRTALLEEGPGTCWSGVEWR